jgi:dTDP-4-amino-4,6-dideoxygalactose transaminase
VRAGATPVFCDVDRWGTMDLDKAQALGTPASRP